MIPNGFIQFKREPFLSAIPLRKLREPNEAKRLHAL